MSLTLTSFTDEVHKMRLAQKRYFELSVEARKNGIHKKEQKDALVIAKNLEAQVDHSIKQILAGQLIAPTLPETKTIAPETFNTISEKPL